MLAVQRYALALVICSLALACAQTGRLEEGDGQLNSGEYFDAHTYAGTAGERLDVSLASGDFDPYLIILDPQGGSLFQEDDTLGHGLDVSVTLELPSTGAYTLLVTSSYAGETGAYTLSISSAASSALAPNPLAATGPSNPLAPSTADSPFAGTFTGDGIELTLEVTGTDATGTLLVAGGSYNVQGSVAGDSFSGTFGNSGQRFGLSATLASGTQLWTEGERELLLESGGASYRLSATAAPGSAAAPAAPPNPLAAPTAAPPATTAATQTPSLLPAPEITGPVFAPGPRSSTPRPRGNPVPGIGPRAGFVTGTVFDTQGRPLAGAGVLIRGTTYVQGQRTSFETVTGADGTYAVRVPDGRYGARAWIDVPFQGVTYSRILHPLSGNRNSEIDSEVGGTLDFQWLLSGLISPPGNYTSDYYGAAINLSYCGLPADAFCSGDYAAFPDHPVPGGSTIVVTLTPVGPLIDGSEGQVLHFQFTAHEQDAEYPYGGAPNAPAGFEDGGAGRLVLGADWEYSSEYLHDIPLGIYDMTAVAVLPGGGARALRLGLSQDDVEHASVRVSFTSWDDFSGRAYQAGGLSDLDVYIRD